MAFFVKKLLFSQRQIFFFFSCRAKMKTTMTPCAWFLGQKRAGAADVSDHSSPLCSSSSSPSEEGVCVSLSPAILPFLYQFLSLCVCCRTLATEVTIHDFGVCFPPKVACTTAPLTTSWYLFDFQLSSQDAIQVRGRREPQQAPLYHAQDINFEIQCHAQHLLLLIDVAGS